MKVLIFDDNSSRKELIALISLYSVEIKVEGTDDPKKFLDHYSKNSYDVVFINTNKKEGVQLKLEVFQNNSSQRIVSINNSLECSDLLGCDHCMEQTNSYRIFKPFEVIALVRSFRDIKCELNYCDDRLITKLHIFSKAIGDLEFDEESLRYKIKYGNKNDILSHSSIFDLIELLNGEDIQYEVEKDYIQVLQKG